METTKEDTKGTKTTKGNGTAGSGGGDGIVATDHDDGAASRGVAGDGGLRLR